MSDQVYTHSNIEFYVSTSPQNADLDLSGYKGISDWLSVGAVGSVPERGINTNMLTYDTVNSLVAKKSKGITDAGSGTLECARNNGDVGQIQLTAAGQPDNFNSYAFKLVKQDGTIEYSRALVAGPSYPGGRNEDFDLANFALAYQQAPIESTGADTIVYDVVVTDALAFVLQAGIKKTASIAKAAADSAVKLAIDNAGFTVTPSVVTGSAGTYVVTLTSAAQLTGIGATVTQQ